MLGRRLASAAVIISVLIGLIAIDLYLGRDSVLGRSGLIVSPVCFIVAMMFAGEMTSLFRQHCSDLISLPVVLIAGISVAICSVPIMWRDYPVDCSIGLFGWTMIALAFAVGMTVLLSVIKYDENRLASAVCAYSVLIHVQVILLFGFFIAHRLLFFDNATGMLALITLITTVKMSDAAAYFVGRAIGQRKLAAKLSPGKTVEGFLGGFFGAILGTAIVVYLVEHFLIEIERTIPIWWVIVYSVAITIAGVVGDLTESLFKRDAKIKDSSSWLPGLGGVLDITDSLVFAAPISFFLWVLTK